MPPPAAAVAHALLLLPPATPSTSPPKLSLSKGPSTHLSLVNPCFGIAPLSSSFRRPIRCSASVAEASAPASETVVRARRPSPAEVVRTIMELSSTGTLSAVTQEGWPLGIGARFVVDGQGMPALCLGQHADGRFAAGSRSSFHVQLEQNGSRTPQCTVLGNLGKPDDSFLIKKLHASWEKKFGEELDTNLVYVVSVERVLYMENFKEDGSWITSSEYINADPDPLRNFAARLVDEMNDKHMEDVQRLCNVYVDAEFQMSTSDPSPAMSSNSVGVRSQDPGWKYGIIPDPSNKNKIKCNFCGHVSNGGIFRFKKHLACMRGDIEGCQLVPVGVKDEIIAYLETGKAKKAKKLKEMEDLKNTVNIKDDSSDEEPILVIGNRKKPRKVGPMDKYTSKDPVVVIEEREKMKQSTIPDKMKKQQRDQVCQYIANWFYEAGIPMNAASLKSFHVMIEAIGQYGPGMKAPSPYEISEPLLKKQVELTHITLEPHREEWVSNGCSLMTDAWTDRKGRSIMNLCVNSRLGTTFLRSIDASNDIHDAQYIFNLVDKCIDELGPQNVVQVVTDNASANIAASHLLKEKKPQIFWTPCAAHCIDLMLEAIGGLQRIKTAITKSRELTTFIYSHHSSLSMMRRCTSKRDLVRPGVTRFATAYLTLQSLLEKRDKLRFMFTSDEWTKCRLAKQVKGQKAVSTVLSPNFWRGVILALKAFKPLVKVLRLVDSEKKPSMGFIYHAMKCAKQEVLVAFDTDQVLCKQIVDIIDKKWDFRLHRPLHAAGYYLNPYYFYSDKTIETDPTINEGLMDCIETLFPEPDVQDMIMKKEIPVYKDEAGVFAKPYAKRQRQDPDLDPVHWWRQYGYQTPNLQKMALRILNLTTTSSGCERNWSSFESIHTKKRNRLEQKKLNDLVYVQFNAKLRERKERVNDAKDPLVSKEMSNAKEWLGEDPDEDEVYAGSGLTWRLVGDASGANELAQNRRSSRFNASAPNSTSSINVMSSTDEVSIASDEETEEEDAFVELENGSDDDTLSDVALDEDGIY